VRLLPKLLWLILALFALENALRALRYLLPRVPFPAEIDNFTQRITLSLQALGGAIAWLAGPLQFVPRFRESNWCGLSRALSRYMAFRVRHDGFPLLCHLP